ncbi:hypothetical protein HDU67_008640 [Dinochytrium kinnereticum]|nr:hypothetical protein HDU67_008640 [Dinochytrium kinnereticum]
MSIAYTAEDLIPTYYGESFPLDRILELILASWCIYYSSPVVAYAYSILPASLEATVTSISDLFAASPPGIIFFDDAKGLHRNLPSPPLSWQFPSDGFSAEGNTSSFLTPGGPQGTGAFSNVTDISVSLFQTVKALTCAIFAIGCLGTFFAELVWSVFKDVRCYVREGTTIKRNIPDPSTIRTDEGRAKTVFASDLQEIGSKGDHKMSLKPVDALSVTSSESETDDSDTCVGSEPSTPSPSLRKGKWPLSYPLFVPEDQDDGAVRFIRRRGLPNRESDGYDDDDSASTASTASTASGSSLPASASASPSRCQGFFFNSSISPYGRLTRRKSWMPLYDEGGDETSNHFVSATTPLWSEALFDAMMAEPSRGRRRRRSEEAINGLDCIVTALLAENGGRKVSQAGTHEDWRKCVPLPRDPESTLVGTILPDLSIR